MKKLVYILFIVFIAFSCKKEVNSNGYDLLSSDDEYKVGAIDTFSIKTATVSLDTASTNNPAYLLLGTNNDPVFGKTEASFCSQLRLVTTSPNFGDISTIAIDSVVLSIRYNDSYGVNKPLKFSVFRLTEDLKSQTYFSNSVISDDAVNLSIDPTNSITPRVNGSYFVSYSKDTIYDQITLRLKNELGKELIQKSIESPSTYTSIENFNSWFKGIKVVAKNENNLDNNGAIYYISTSPRLIIYYTQSGVSKKYYFELNQNANRVNLIKSDNADFEAGKGLSLKNGNYFTQSNKLRAQLTLPSLSDIPRNSVVHSGKLILPYDDNLSVFYSPGYQVSVSIPNSSSDNRLRIIGYGNIDTTNHVFVVDIREHIQSVISGKRLNIGLYISPREFSTTATRIKFLNDGAQSVPKLYLKVSSFNKQ